MEWGPALRLPQCLVRHHYSGRDGNPVLLERHQIPVAPVSQHGRPSVHEYHLSLALWGGSAPGWL